MSAEIAMTGMKGPKNAPNIMSLGTQTSSEVSVMGVLFFRCRCECIATAVALKAAVTVRYVAIDFIDCFAVMLLC